MRKFEDPDLLQDAQEVLATLAPREREVRSESGRWYVRRILPYRTPDGQVDGIVVTFVEITERRHVEEALRESEMRSRVVVEAAGMGFWDWGLATRIVRWDHRHRQIMGLGNETSQGTPEEFLARVHPEDRQRVAAATRVAIDAGTDYQAEYRVVHPDGEVRWVASFGRALPSDHGCRPE